MRVLVAVALMLAAPAVLAGCAAARPAPAASAPAENGPAITWSDHVCEVVRAGGVKLSQLPAVDPAAPQQAKDGLVRYLGSLSDALADLAAGITKEGVPPVHDGQATLDRAMNTLTASKSSVDSARTRLAAATVTDQATFSSAVRDAGAAFASLGSTDGPAKDLTANPELARAFGEAPNCRNLDGA